jgi:hypothetical protein
MPKDAKPTTEQDRQTTENEGEGSRSAARRYNEGVEEYVKSGRVEEAAEKAEDAVDGPEGEELRRAEEEGKRSPKP